MSVATWSVVVPTFNRPKPLSACVTALAALRPPAGGFEIVVVNDGGVEPPETIRAAALAGNASCVLFITQPNGGPASARNFGAAHARGQWLAFTDDDCAPSPDWLLALERALAASPDALVGGAVVNALKSNLFAETSQQLVEYVMRYFDGTSQRERFFTSNNIALSRTAFLEAGGFDVRLGKPTGEDREFCDRWHAQGRTSVREAHAVVHHAHALTVVSFLRQHIDYGRGARSFRAVRRAADRPVRIDPSFYLGSLRHAWRQRPLWRGAVLAAGTAAAHFAYMLGLLASSIRRREPGLPAAPAPGEPN